MLVVLTSLVVVLLIATVVNFGLLIALLRRLSAARSLPPVGTRVSPFVTALNDGSEWTAADLAGHATGVLFVSAECTSCRRLLHRLESRPEDLAVTVVLVLEESDRVAAEELVRAVGTRARAVGRIDLEVMTSFGAVVTPTAMLVEGGVVGAADHDGDVLKRAPRPALS